MARCLKEDSTQVVRLGEVRMLGLCLRIVPLFIGVLITEALSAQSLRYAKNVLDRREIDGEVIYIGESLKLNKNEKLIFEEPARVYLKDLELEEFSEINSQGNPLEFLVEDFKSNLGVVNVSPLIQETSGADGQDGEHGSKGLNGLKGTAGAHGVDGSDGSDGGDAAPISIITPYLRGDVVLIAKGGNGGRGGNGGDGGNGGAGLSGQDARVLYRFRGMDHLPIEALIKIGAAIGVPVVGEVLVILQLFNGLTIGDGFDGFDGGDGGNAGRGGNGGNGGNGGSIELVYAARLADGKIYVNTRGGAGGAGGRSGAPGIGGPGGAGGKAGDIWGRDGYPGKPGALGLSAPAGVAGRPGKSGSIRVIETGDAQWLKCYIQYRQVLDLSGDSQLASFILRSCLQ